MRIGERCAGRGFTYLWLLFVLAIGSASLAVIGQRWSAAVQRDRERELLFRGGEIASAIAAYHAASGVTPAEWPRALDELIEDRRGVVPVRHLRRVYTDPFTLEANWARIGTEDGRWQGVRSRSEAPAMLRGQTMAVPEPARSPRVSDHVFDAKVTPPSSAGSAPQAAENGG